ncbi:transporter [soil metagenome]
MRILMILVSDADTRHPKPPPVLQFERFLEPYYLFIDAGAEIVLASLAGGDPAMRTASGERSDATPFMRRFQADQGARDALVDTLSLEQVEPDDFDGAYCIGVSGGIWPPRVDNPSGAMVGQLLSAGKPVVVIPSQLDLDPAGVGAGLLIADDQAVASSRAAHALLAAIRQPQGST